MEPTRVERVLGLKPLGGRAGLFGSLVRMGLNGRGAFLAHGFVDKRRMPSANPPEPCSELSSIINTRKATSPILRDCGFSIFSLMRPGAKF